MAVPITFTEQAVTSGIFDGVSYTNQLTTITVTGDTANVTSPQPGVVYEISAATGTVTVAGVGTDTLTGPVQVFSNTGAMVDEIDAGSSIIDQRVLSTSNSAFSTYDLTTAIGPVSGAAGISAYTFNTAGGFFSIFSSSSPSTFTATFPTTTVPEPSTMLLLGASLAGLAVLRVRRNA